MVGGIKCTFMCNNNYHVLCVTHVAQITGITVSGIYCINTFVYHILSCIFISGKVSLICGIIDGYTQIVPYKKCKYIQFFSL